MVTTSEVFAFKGSSLFLCMIYRATIWKCFESEFLIQFRLKKPVCVSEFPKHISWRFTTILSIFQGLVTGQWNWKVLTTANVRKEELECLCFPEGFSKLWSLLEQKLYLAPMMSTQITCITVCTIVTDWLTDWMTLWGDSHTNRSHSNHSNHSHFSGYLSELPSILYPL